MKARGGWHILGWCAPILALAGCHEATAHRPAGDPAAGAAAITRMACGSCHVIPGIAQADGDVGPPLAHFARQQMIAGRLPNSPGNLARYLAAPRVIVPGNAMPDQRLSPAQARDIAAYLETLR